MDSIETRKDYAWLNDDSRLFLKRGYLKEGVEPEARYREIAEYAESILGIPGFANKFENYIARGWFSLASPVIANFGAGRALPISCNGSALLDRMDSILYKVAEIGMMTKSGAGTSAYLGALRPRGASISGGGVSTGPVHFAQLLEATTNVVSQSSVRRGSCAIYLDVEHPDIMEFLQIRDEGHPIQNLSIGVCIGDEWMNNLIAGDKAIRKIWAKIIQKRFESGYPYIFFRDTANNNKPQVYKDKDLSILASNLCVVGSERVVTSTGLHTVKDLYNSGRSLTLFDGSKPVKSSAMKLVEKNADVFKITLENGMSHTVTSYHKVKVEDKGSYKALMCKDLKIGDKVFFQSKKGLFGSKDMIEEAFLLGQYQADGTQTKNSIMFDLWEHSFDLVPTIENLVNNLYDKYKVNIKEPGVRVNKIPKFNDCVVSQSEVKKKRLVTYKIPENLGFKKGKIPEWIWECNEDTHWSYLKGLFYADGTVNITKSKGEPLYLSISNINLEFLKDLQILMANLGLKSSISLGKEAGNRLLPDGKGGKKYYTCKACWRLTVGNKPDALEFEKNTGFLTRKNKVVEDRIYRDNTKKTSKVASVKYVGKEDVYCVNVDSDDHFWVCNGIVTHNCVEISLNSTEDESFVCDLGALNAMYWDEWKDTDAVRVMTYFLDAVMTDYINKTEDIPFMAAPNRFAKNQRALGIGILGWHSYLQSIMVPFESIKAKQLNISIWKRLRDESLEASKELAEKFGEPELLKGYGLRNVTTLCAMPTTSSSFILGQVSQSIEPMNSNYYVKDLAKGKFTYRNPKLKEVLKEHGKDDANTWKSILLKGGSVQHLDFLSENEKMVFKTFGEISQKEIVIQAASRQEYIDQGQSLNLMIHPKTPPKEVSNLMIYAWENKVKSLYYQRGVSQTQELGRSIMAECVNCEA